MAVKWSDVHRTSNMLHGHSADAVQRWSCIELRLCQKVEKCRGDRYLKMAPSDSPLKTTLETSLFG